METDAAGANPQRGYHLLEDNRLAAAETAPELPREISAADLPPLQGPRAKVKVEPCSTRVSYMKARKPGEMIFQADCNCRIRRNSSAISRSQQCELAKKQPPGAV